MTQVSHKLRSVLEGALAGGGDPATSPLYVFGPFLRLIVAGGVASITFGATVWLAVFTVAVVSVMYRMVMIWVTDGSGGSGLSEEEFGPWAVKVNAAITFVEYTLTFLVSMAALVTFIADRWPSLAGGPAWLPHRTLLAVVFSCATGFAVNRGPRVAARVFGPATAGVLVLLWVMVVAAVVEHGFHLPDFQMLAFHSKYLHFTLGGYARILALMTGIEIFANLVPAYEGTPSQRSRRAFRSLLVVMGTTVVMMLVVGPVIREVADPTRLQVSVFTQAMDRLLPAPLSYLGTLVGIAVLLSACAASAQGLQNLAVGLRYRHYVPASLGRRNRFEVAGRPVLLEVGLAILCFLVFGTAEETYLSLYAAGVFILLSMTGWAASKRLIRNLRGRFSVGRGVALAGTVLAALLTSVATLIIFKERFTEGVWAYLLFLPVIFAVFTHYRTKLGLPTPVETRLGRLHVGGLFPGATVPPPEDDFSLNRILVPLDGSMVSEQGLIGARLLAHEFEARLQLLLVEGGAAPEAAGLAKAYLKQVGAQLGRDGLLISTAVGHGPPAQAILAQALELEVDLIVLSRVAPAGVESLWVRDTAEGVLKACTVPLLLIRPTESWKSRRPSFTRLLLPLDGSAEGEAVLPCARALADRFHAEIVFLSGPEGSESEHFPRMIQTYLEAVAAPFAAAGLRVQIRQGASGPARCITETARIEAVDLILLSSHGRGGTGRMEQVPVGSVTKRVVEDAPCPVLVVPLRSSRPEE